MDEARTADCIIVSMPSHRLYGRVVAWLVCRLYKHSFLSMSQIYAWPLTLFFATFYFSIGWVSPALE